MILKVFICFTAILFSSARHRAGAGERGTATCQGLKNVPMISLHIGFQWFGGILNFLIKLKLNLYGTQNVIFSAFFWKSWNLHLCHVFQPLLSLWGRHTSSLLGGTGPGMGLGSETKLCYIAENHIEDRDIGGKLCYAAENHIEDHWETGGMYEDWILKCTCSELLMLGSARNPKRIKRNICNTCPCQGDNRYENDDQWLCIGSW